ncbi:MAG: periplasmic heavy metal sensor, partial [Caldimonas sp.]
MSEVRAVQGRKGRVVQWLVGSVLVVAAVVAAVSVHAQGRHGRSMEGGLGGGVSMFGGSPEMTAHGLDRMLDGLNATEAQRTQVRQIAMAAAAELRSLREAGRALHEKAMQIFTAPTVDAAAAESLRQQSLAQHDQASKRVLQA